MVCEGLSAEKVGPYCIFLVFFRLSAQKLRSLVRLSVASGHFSNLSVASYVAPKNFTAILVIIFSTLRLFFFFINIAQIDVKGSY